MRFPLIALADAANVSREGKLNITGEFDSLFVPDVPAKWPLMVFVARIKTGEEDVGKHSVRLRIVDDDMQVLSMIEAEMNVGPSKTPGLEGGGPLIINILNATFPGYGTYTFQLTVGDRWKTEAHLHVRKREESPVF